MAVAIIRSSDVLPAPFGPSSPNTPGPVCRSTPATASVRPNRRVKPVISMFIMPPTLPGPARPRRHTTGPDPRSYPGGSRAARPARCYLGMTALA